MRTVFLACPALPWYSGGTKHKREGGASMYRTEVKVAALPVAEWMKRYCFPGRFLDSCKQCPDYGRVWSCPPGVPEAGDYLGAYRMAHIIGVKVLYDDGERARALRSPKEAETVRQETYGVVKRPCWRPCWPLSASARALSRWRRAVASNARSAPASRTCPASARNGCAIPSPPLDSISPRWRRSSSAWICCGLVRGSRSTMWRSPPF